MVRLTGMSSHHDQVQMMGMEQKMAMGEEQDQMTGMEWNIDQDSCDGPGGEQDLGWG